MAEISEDLDGLGKAHLLACLPDISGQYIKSKKQMLMISNVLPQWSYHSARAGTSAT